MALRSGGCDDGVVAAEIINGCRQRNSCGDDDRNAIFCGATGDQPPKKELPQEHSARVKRVSIRDSSMMLKQNPDRDQSWEKKKTEIQIEKRRSSSIGYGAVVYADLTTKVMENSEPPAASIVATTTRRSEDGAERVIDGLQKTFSWKSGMTSKAPDVKSGKVFSVVPVPLPLLHCTDCGPSVAGTSAPGRAGVINFQVDHNSLHRVYPDEEEAGKAYDSYIIQHLADFGILNFPK